MLMIFFVLQTWSFLRKKRKELVAYSCSSPQSYCLKYNSKITLHDFDAQSKPDVLKIFILMTA